MKSAANTFIRIIAWACVVFGVLFTILQAWLVGVPLLMFGVVGLCVSNISKLPVQLGSEADSSTAFDHRTQADEQFWIDQDETDPRSPVFRLTEDLRERGSPSSYGS
jgi:hypothetical protein